jgi:hypothetical protein
MTQRVYSRAAPPPVQVPFVQQQKALVANPGRPIDPVALAGMQRGQQAAPRAVTVVNTAALVRQKNPPVVPQPAVRPVPAVQQKPATPVAVAPQPAVKPAPAVQQKPATPVAVAPQPAVRPAPAVQQKPAAPAMQQKPVPSAAASKTGSSASTLLATLRTRTLPDADQRLSEAKNVAGIHLDINAVSQQLAAAKQSLADAEKDLAAGNSDQAQQKGIAVQKKIEDQTNQISAAVQDAKQGPRKP